MKIAELALAGLAIGAPAVMGNAWLNVGIYKNKECNGKLYGFTNVDVTASFTSFKVLTNIGLGAAAPIPGQCTDLNSFAAELGSITLDAQQTASLAAAVDFPPIAIGFSAYISGQVVMKNLPTILAGSCIPVKSGEETVAYIKGGCTDGTTAPAVPSALTSYAVRTASTTAGCNYDSAYLVQGVVADKNPHKELGGTWQLSSNEQVLVAVSLGLLTQTQGTAQLTSSTKASFPFTTTGTCSGGGNQGPLAANASIAVNVNGIAFTDNLALARARTCTSGSANNVTVYYQTVCRPGGGQPNGGKSLITANAPTNVTKRFNPGQGNNNKQDYGNGGLSLGVKTSAQTDIQVAFSSEPAIATDSPQSAFNTYYQITSDASGTAGFAANLTFTYTDDMLTSFGNLAAANLKWAKYNPTTASWDVKTDTSVDVSAKTATYETTSFSEWTVVVSATGTSAAFMSATPSFMMLVTFVALVAGVSW